MDGCGAPVKSHPKSKPCTRPSRFSRALLVFPLAKIRCGMQFQACSRLLSTMMEPAGIEFRGAGSPGSLHLHKDVDHWARDKSPTLSQPLTAIQGQGKQLRSREGSLRQEGNDAGTSGLEGLPWGIPASLSQQGQQMCSHHLVPLLLLGRRGGGRGKASASNILILKRWVFCLQGGRARGGWTRPPGEEGTDLRSTRRGGPAVKQPLQP